jgi:hypothetical protein
MSKENLITVMQGASGTHERHSLIDTAIRDDLAAAVALKGDIVTFICMPGQRLMEQVINAWQVLLIDGTQSETPNGADFSPFEWRSPITHSPSTMNTQVIVGSVETSNSYIGGWTIEKWRIWGDPVGAGGTYTPLPAAQHVHVGTADRSYNTTGEILTNDILTSLGIDTDISTLDQYIAQWNFGMEWLHAKPINVLNGDIGTDPNPYAGGFRGYGVNTDIEQKQQSVGVMATTTDFLLRKFNFHNTLLS